MILRYNGTKMPQGEGRTGRQSPYQTRKGAQEEASYEGCQGLRKGHRPPGAWGEGRRRDYTGSLSSFQLCPPRLSTVRPSPPPTTEAQEEQKPSDPVMRGLFPEVPVVCPSCPMCMFHCPLPAGQGHARALGWSLKLPPVL